MSNAERRTPNAKRSFVPSNYVSDFTNLRIYYFRIIHLDFEIIYCFRILIVHFVTATSMYH